MPTPALPTTTRIDHKPAFGLDTEGWLIQPGRQAPPLVCTSIADTRGMPSIYDRAESREAVRAIVDIKDSLLVLHNAAFDFGMWVQEGVLSFAEVFYLYEQERIADTMIWQKLWMIKNGWDEYCPKLNQKPPSYKLDSLAKYWLDEHISGKYGEDSWRLRYHELDGTPIEQWPAEARNYALYDSTYPLRIWHMVTEKHGVLPDFWRQMTHAWALGLFSARGLRTQDEVVREVEKDVVEHIDDVVGELAARGLYKRSGTLANPKWSKSTKEIHARVRAYFERIGEPCPMTDPSTKHPQGQVKADKEILEEIQDDEELQMLLEVSNDTKLKSTYLDWCLIATEWAVNPSYDSLKATGRSSSFNPNVQQMPRKGGIRECYVPRVGYVFVDCDYSIAELRSLSQVLINMYGHSQMAETIKASDLKGHGYDIHCLMGAAIMGITLDEFAERFNKGEKQPKEMRQLGKPVNFGVPGGLGAKTLRKTAWVSYGVRMTLEEAKTYIDLYKRIFPEMEQYFTDVGAATGFGGKFDVIQHGSGRVRGQVGYCDGCNTNFQALTADGAKLACWNVAKECYTGLPYTVQMSDALEAFQTSGFSDWHEWVMSLDDDERSPLYGSFPVWFIHDEIGLESPFHLAQGAAARLSQVMVESMNVFTPDVPAVAEADIRRRWYKAAEATYDASGTLVPWVPKSPRSALKKTWEKEKDGLLKDNIARKLGDLMDPTIVQGWTNAELAVVEECFPPPKKDPKQWKEVNQMWRWELLARERNPDPWC